MIPEPQLDRIAPFLLAGGIAAIVAAVAVVLHFASAEILGL